jgi:DNA-binding transcriptional ArsR family regulator
MRLALIGDLSVTYSSCIDDDDLVFKALADPTRRRVLDLLFSEDGRTLGALCGEFPDLTRFGVMKHLAVLEGAGLVVTRRVGRSKHHYLNPVPIAEIQRRWLSKYAEVTTDALLGLRRALEE